MCKPLCSEYERSPEPNPDMQEKIVDDIIMGAHQNVTQVMQDIRNELKSIKAAEENLWKAIESGLTDTRVYERLANYGERTKALQERLNGHKSASVHSREFYIEDIKKDAERAASDPSCMKELDSIPKWTC